MKLFKTSLCAALITLLTFQFSYAHQCAQLFGEKAQHLSTNFTAMKESLQNIQSISGSGIKLYQDTKTDKVLTIIYDINRSQDKNLKKEIDKAITNNEDSLPQFSFGKEQKQILAENIRELSKHATVAVINPYLRHTELEQLKVYGLYEVARSELGFALKQHSRTEAEKKLKTFTQKSLELAKQHKKAIWISFIAGGSVLMLPTEVQVGLPVLISSVGFALHSAYLTYKQIFKNQQQGHTELSEEIVKRSFENSDRVVLIAPMEVKQQLEGTYNQAPNLKQLN